MSRLAVVLFNLGGPDKPEAVRPFLRNLFKDPAIIGAPAPIRLPLAALIAWRRAPIAREIYEHLGGGSPLLPETQRQADALQQALQEAEPAHTVKVFIAMRYWHPMADETLAAVQAFAPDQIVLLPLYPQFSTTTSQSSVRQWLEKAKRKKLSVPTRTVGCYPTAKPFVAAHVEKLRAVLDSVPQPRRILFSAHGLPEVVIKRGDPYQSQVEATVNAVHEALGGGEDVVTCYQSRVGPLKWIGPSTEDEIRRAGEDGRHVVLVPVAFVSEHSETLVELDIEYAELAQSYGVPGYHRVPTLGDHPAFIQALAEAVTAAASSGDWVTCPGRTDAGRCAAQWATCPHRAGWLEGGQTS